MKADQFYEHLIELIGNTLRKGLSVPWYMRAAISCVAAGHVHYINQRRSDDLYLVRMWLTPPKPSTEEGGRFESGAAVLLHWFACGDDDQALHDHPWAFVTTVLAGGYWEHLPKPNKATFEQLYECCLGPAWNAHRVWRGVGAEVVHGCADLHCVADPLPDTFTLVRTGARINEWGFHPEGQPWISSARYLDRKKADAAHA